MNRLRRIDVRALEDTEDLVAFYTDATNLADGYNSLGIDVPEWLSSKVADATHEITERARAAKKARLSKLRAKAEALKPDETKLAETLAAIKALEKELA